MPAPLNGSSASTWLVLISNLWSFPKVRERGAWQLHHPGCDLGIGM